MKFNPNKDGGLTVDLSGEVSAKDGNPVVLDIDSEDVDSYFSINPTSTYEDLGDVVMSAVREYIYEGSFGYSYD